MFNQIRINKMEGIVLQGGDRKEFLELNNKVDKLSANIEILVNEKFSEKISPEAASDEWGVTPQTIYAKIKKGEIKASKIGRKILIKRIDLDNALTEVKSLKYKR